MDMMKFQFCLLSHHETYSISTTYLHGPVCGVVWVEDAELLAGLHEAGDQEVAGEGEHVPRPLGPPQRHVPGPPHLVSTNKHFVGE